MTACCEREGTCPVDRSDPHRMIPQINTMVAISEEGQQGNDLRNEWLDGRMPAGMQGSTILDTQYKTALKETQKRSTAEADD